MSKADKVIRFIRSLKHTKGKWASVPFTLLPWQIQALTDIFGTTKENGKRRYNFAYLEISKKQGKSELGAAIALQGLCNDDEWAAEVYGCAADRAQARIIYDVAVDMVDQHSELKKHIKLIPSQNRMIYMPTKSFYQVLSAEAYSKHGLNASRVVFDELHAQPNRKLYDVMTEGSGDAREQPLFFIITTAGDDPDRNSIGYEVHKKAEDILLGQKTDDTFYSMIYGIDRDNKRIWKGREYESSEEDWTDEEVYRKVISSHETWKKINPSLGHTVDLEKVQNQWTAAAGNLAKEKNFRWLRLNEWVKLKTNKWLSLDFWDACKKNINIERLKGRPCYGGLDLSSKIDLTSFVLLFPPNDIATEWVVLPYFWLPEDNLAERVHRDNVKYDEWYHQGYLKTTPGNVIDYKHIEREIIRLSGEYNIQEIGYDPWNAMQTAIAMEEEGLQMVEVRQGYKSMSPPMKEIEQLTMGKKLIHNQNPMLRWNVGNVEVKGDDNDNIRPVKGKATERIDGLVAFINAMNRAIHEIDNTSIYEERGVR